MFRQFETVTRLSHFRIVNSHLHVLDISSSKYFCIKYCRRSICHFQKAIKLIYERYIIRIAISIYQKVRGLTIEVSNLGRSNGALFSLKRTYAILNTPKLFNGQLQWKRRLGPEASHYLPCSTEIMVWNCTSSSQCALVALEGATYLYHLGKC